MQARRNWQALGATAATSLVLLGTAGLGSGAQAAGALTKCGNKKFTVEIAQGTVPETFKPFKIAVKNINVSGVSCTAAFKFIGLVYKSHTSTVPEHYKCTTGKFKEPVGFVPQVCTHKGAKIEYGGQGG
jgi:hypothetical protein